MSPQLERKTLVFVLRVWREYLARGIPILRGEIEDVTRQEKHTFSGITELQQILQNSCLEDTPEQKPESNQAQG